MHCGGGGGHSSIGYCKPIEKVEKPKMSEPKSIEPIKLIDPTNPIEPIESTKPIEPVEPIELTKPIEPVEPINPTKPIGPIKPIEPRHYISSTPSSWHNKEIIIGIASLVFIAIFIVIVVVCFKCCRRRKPDQPTAIVSPHAPSPAYGVQPMMAPMSPSAPPMMYSPHQQQSPHYY